MRPRLLRTILLLCLGATCAWPQAGKPALVVPGRLVAGEPATLAVLDSTGRLSANAEVEFSGGLRVTTDATGRAAFTAPEQSGVVTAWLVGGNVTATSMVLQPSGRTPSLQLDAPQLLNLRDRFTIHGWRFSGTADANRVTLGGHPAVVLAASPLSLVVVAGAETPAGPAELSVESDGQALTPLNVTLVAIELQPEKPSLAPKEKGKFTVRVAGAWQKLDLEVRNLSPDTVKMMGGDLQRVTTSGNTDNRAELELQGRRAGDYSISVRLVPPALGLPDTQGAIKHLMLAVRLGPPEQVKRIQGWIHRLERHPQDAPKVQVEIERLLSEKLDLEFAQAVQAAWLALLKR